RPHDLLPQLVDLDRDRVRHLVAREPERLLADELRDLQLLGKIRSLLHRKVERPFREEPDELVSQLADTVARLRADRMQRVEVAEARSRVHLLGDVTRLEPVHLVERDYDRNAEREDSLRDEAVARADALPS